MGYRQQSLAVGYEALADIRQSEGYLKYSRRVVPTLLRKSELGCTDGVVVLAPEHLLVIVPEVYMGRPGISSTIPLVEDMDDSNIKALMDTRMRIIAADMLWCRHSVPQSVLDSE